MTPALLKKYLKMKHLLTLIISVFIIPIIYLPSKAHTAFDKLKDFKSWTSCEKDTYAKNSKTLSCFFPKNLQDHRDAITVYCEDVALVPTWDKDWMKKYGSYRSWELPPKALRNFPAYSVFYYTSHDYKTSNLEELLAGIGTSGPRISYNDADSPWAKECKRIFN